MANSLTSLAVGLGPIEPQLLPFCETKRLSFDYRERVLDDDVTGLIIIILDSYIKVS